MKRILVLLLASLSFCVLIHAQSSESFIRNFRPIYIVSGFPIDGEINTTTADVKFQLSFGIPLWKHIGGKDDCELFIGYTQGCIWNFYDSSSPMRDNMFSPGLYFNLPFKKDNLLFGIEHRSNGRPFKKNTYDTWDLDRYSRSVNHILVEYTHSFDFGLTLQANLRGGFGWYGIERSYDIYYKFFGFGTLSAMYETPKKILGLAISATPTFEPFDCNIDAEITIRPFKKEYLPVFFIQYHKGWDFSMCDWVRDEPAPLPAIRFGVMFSPRNSVFRLSR